MTTEKQNKINKQNAQLSTGAKTAEGKLIVSKNAVKHGVFTKDLIIQAGDGKEELKEYQEILDNLVECLKPEGQMESLLVEKIAVDFWRLRRVIRFETGSIRKVLDSIIEKFYTPGKYDDIFEHKCPKPKTEIDEEIKETKGVLQWNAKLIGFLEKGLLKFDKPEWNKGGFEVAVEEELALVLEEFSDDIFNQEQKTRFEAGEFSFDEMRTILTEQGYTDKKLSEVLVRIYKKQNWEYQDEISKLERQKQQNVLAEEVQVKINYLPNGEHAEKIMRYERSIQKSIYQNLAVLKRLQTMTE